MPFVIEHNSQVGALAGLAANVGGFKTQGDLYQRSLQGDAARRANAEQAFRQQEADSSGEESMYRTILQDMTARQLSSDRLQNSQDLLGQRGDQNLEGIYAKGGIQQGIASANLAGANQRATDRNQVTSDVAQANRDSREGIAYSNQDLGYDRIASQDQNAAANRQARQDLELQKQQERQDFERLKTAEQARRRGAEFDARTKTAMINAEMKELVRLRGINENRATRGIDPNAAGMIGFYNSEIQKRVQDLGRVQGPQQPPPGNGAGFAAPDYPTGAGGGANYDAGPGLEGPAPQAGGPIQVRSRAEALALPSGTPFIDPDGVLRVRP